MSPVGSATSRSDQSRGTPDLLRQLVEAACAAIEEVAAIGRDVESRRAQLAAAESHLDQAARLVERGRRELTSVATEIVRVSLPEGACGAPWPACNHFPGTALTASGGASWCPSCGRSGGVDAARSAYLCTQQATVTVRDAAGAEAAMCLSHAVGAVRDIAGLTVIEATADELQAMILHSHRPIRVDTSRPGHRPELLTRQR